jgi:hypothetical protein
MAPLRRLLAPLTAIWLFCQLGTVLLVPVAVSAGASDSHAAECTCGHGAEATCPMHHKPAGSAKPCAMQSTNIFGAGAISSLVGIAGVLGVPTHSIGLVDQFARRPALDAHLTGQRPVPPDPPPPRV